MDDREARDRIIQAIAASKYRWRTPRGIAKESGVPLPQVMETLERSDAFIRSRKGNDRGEPLYSTKTKYREETSFGERVLTALTNRID
jgi:hypothetical protein